jgi:hypothetical protein
MTFTIALLQLVGTLLFAVPALAIGYAILWFVRRRNRL